MKKKLELKVICFGEVILKQNKLTALVLVFFWGAGKNSNKGKIIEFTFDEDERNFSKNSENPNIYFINGFTTDQPEETL